MAEPMPKGSVSSIWINPSTAFSAQTKMGPTATSVTSTVTKTETSGVTKRSNISGTILCRRFSMNAMMPTAMTMGMT